MITFLVIVGLVLFAMVADRIALTRRIKRREAARAEVAARLRKAWDES